MTLNRKKLEEISEPRSEKAIISEAMRKVKRQNYPDMLRLAGDVKYIRKDVLMKIIATARESAIIQRNFNNCPTEQEARIDAYDYIKHKIESL